MAIFNEKIRGQLVKVFKNMKNEVNIVVFTQGTGGNNKTINEFFDEIEEMSEKIKLTKFDFERDSEKAKEYGVDKAPAVVLLNHKNEDNGIKFYGLPVGHEINSFITGILEVSGVGETIPEDFLNRIKAIDKDVHIQVFITLACPHCPGAVATAHRLALENKHIKADMVDCQTFPYLADEYNVSSVPKVVFNGEKDFLGSQPLQNFIEVLEQL